MVILKFLTIYAFLALVAHYFIFQYGCSKYLERFPDHMQKVIHRARWWHKIYASIILALPIFCGILIIVGLNLYLDIKILIIKLRSYRMRAFVYLYEKYPWYEKKLYKKKVLFYVSSLIFGWKFVSEMVALGAGTIVAEILLKILSNLNKKQKDESKNIDSVSDQGAPGEIS
jgi:hypothetical protein